VHKEDRCYVVFEANAAQGRGVFAPRDAHLDHLTEATLFHVNVPVHNWKRTSGMAVSYDMNDGRERDRRPQATSVEPLYY
jgi:hypothetical protein